MDDGAHPQWAMAGEVITALFHRRGSGERVAAGVTTLPGPGILFVARYQTSPIGPFTELAIVEPVLRHPVRIGLGVTRSVVDDERACRQGRVEWGFPREVGTLRWEDRAGVVRVTWEEQGLVVEAVAHRAAFPVLLPLRLLQHRGAEAVVVPVRFRGLARTARITVATPADGPLAELAGTHRGLVLSAPHLRIDPAAAPIRWAAMGARFGRAPGPVAPDLRPNA